VVECGIHTDSRYKIKDGLTKWIFRQSMKDFLPEKIFNRKSKLGFPAPEQEWLQQNKQRISTELAAAALAYPQIFAPDLSKQFEQALDSANDLSPYFRCFSFYRWAQVFQVQVI
jgi:asparagine synthase (glutamine-hydrolysing)